MDGTLLSPAERRRIESLAATAPRHWWIVAPEDPTGEIAACAAAASVSPVLSVTSGSPLPAMQRLNAAGLRGRVHVTAGWSSLHAAEWQRPVGLVCMPAAGRTVRPLLAAWAGHVSPRGYIAFYGGRAADLPALGLRGDLWTSYPEGARSPFLLMRRPFG